MAVTSWIRAEPVDRLDRWGRGAIGTVGVGGAYALGRGLLPFDLSCPILMVTGVPCPFCGITRLADELTQGHLMTAAARDPGGVALFMVLLAIPVFAWLLRPGKLTSPLRSVLTGAIPVVAVTAIGIHWATVVRFGADVVTR